MKERPLLYAHIAVFFFGLAGIIARSVPLDAITVVAGRVFFAALSLLVIILLRRQSFRIHSLRHFLFFSLSGIILAAHWGLFFWSVKISSIAIGLLTVSTFPIFAAILEPIFFKEKFKPKTLIFGLIALGGIVLVIPDFTPGNNALTGALAGTAAGLLFAFLSLINRKFVREYPGTVLAFYQDLFAFVVLLPFVLTIKPVFTLPNIAWLAFLGVFCTGIAHTLFIISLKKLKTATAGILTMLEPVYGILIAIPLFGEIPDLKTVLGGVTILLVAIISSRKNEDAAVSH